MRAKVAQDAEREKRLKVGGSAQSGRDDTPKQRAIQRKQEHHADKAPLFGKRGKYKIRLILGEEAQLRLRAIAYPFAEELAGAHRDR